MSLFQVLSLHNNLLNVFPVWRLSILPSLSFMSVAQNPWTCDCSFVQQLKGYLALITALDTAQLSCADQERGVVNIESNITCVNSLAVPVSQTVAADHHHSLVIIIIFIISVLGVFLVLVVVAVSRTSVQVWLHSHYGVRIRSNTDKDYCVYDAALCYSPTDEVFLQQRLLPYLDSYRLCSGVPSDSSVHRLLILVSRAFLATYSSQVEQLLQDSNILIICVIIEHISPQELALFSQILKQSVVLVYRDNQAFWNNLRFHLPDKSYDYDSSTTTYSTIPTTSPRMVTRTGQGSVIVNPLDQLSDTYESDHLYQTLDPVHHHADEGDMLEVMLPGGQVVPATLVRHASGRVIPLVMSSQQQS